MPRQVIFPPNEVMDEIKPDRKEIIEIVKNIISFEKKTIPGILIHLKYSQLPTGNKVEINASKVKMSRIIKCAESNRSSDSIADIKYSDLLTALKERFPNYPKKIDLKYSEIQENHSNYYIYYYESYSEIEEDYFIKFGVVGLDINPKSKEWETGALYYFNGFVLHKKFLVTRVKPPKTNHNALFFYAKCEDQVNFFTLLINRKPANLRGIIPLTYSVLETQKRFPSAGKAILEKIDNNRYGEKVRKLQIGGVSDEIINALHHKRKLVVLDEVVYENSNDFTTDQMEGLEKLKGFWSGVHLRTDFYDKDRSSEKGGICKFVLKIDRSGECEMFWGKDSSDYKKYSGFVELPFDSSSFIKIYLEFSKKEKTYKIYLILSLDVKSETEYSYKGVITGWTKKEKNIYTAPVYMKRIIDISSDNRSLKLAEILNRENPMRIAKSEKDKISKIDTEYIDSLKKIEDEHISMFRNCMPIVASDSLSTLPHQSNGEIFANRESPELKKLIFEALEESKEILSIGIANKNLTTGQTLDFYKRFLDREGEARIMFLDPKGKEIVKREIVEGWDKGSLINKVAHSVEDLRRFKEFATKNRVHLEDHIQWVCYDFQPIIHALIIDKKIAIIHYYSTNHRGSDVPTILVKKEAGNIFNFYLDEVEKIWDLLNEKTSKR